jgi:hypothetical protein
MTCQGYETRYRRLTGDGFARVYSLLWECIYSDTKLIAQRTAFGHRDLQVIHRPFSFFLIILNLKQDKGDRGRYGLREFFFLFFRRLTPNFPTTER